MLPCGLNRHSSRPGEHWGSQYQVGAAIFLSASKAWEKTRSHREHGILLKIPPSSEHRPELKAGKSRQDVAGKVRAYGIRRG